jgi:TolB-like protein/Flp pilus assembly protein TadD
VGVLIISAAGAIVWRTTLAGSKLPPIRSLAVLPLRDFSGDPDRERFSDATTEVLISSLARIHSIEVISHTSMLRYKGTTKRLPEIAKELGVDAIVEGSVQRSGGRVRISAKLIRAATDKHIWANEYERDLADVLKLEAEVARAIAQEIQAKITPEEIQVLASARSVNVAAQEEYFLGQIALSKLLPVSNGLPLNFPQHIADQANERFGRAIQLQPDYADAYAGLARVKILGMDPNGARELTLKALNLDPNLTDAHVLLAEINYRAWDWTAADREYRLAAESNPSSLEASWPYANFLYATGRFGQGVAFAESSLRRHPFDANMEFQHGINLQGAARYEEAIRALKRAAALDPARYGGMSFGLFDVYITTGRFQEALALAERPGARSNPEWLANLGRVYAGMGRRTEAMQIFRELSALGPKAPRVRMMFFCFELGDKDCGFNLLEKEIDERTRGSVFAKFNPAFAQGVRSDPRFQKIVARLNMPDFQ